MPILESKLNPRSADFQLNAEKMRSIVADLREKVAKMLSAAVKAHAPNTLHAANYCHGNGSICC